MHKVIASTEMNRLYVWTGNTDCIDMVQYVTDIESACLQLEPGFTCLLNVSGRCSMRQRDIDLQFNSEILLCAYGAGQIILLETRRAANYCAAPADKDRVRIKTDLKRMPAGPPA